MKTVLIINEETDKLETSYKIKQTEVENEIKELRKLYDDVSIDCSGDIVVWK